MAQFERGMKPLLTTNIRQDKDRFNQIHEISKTSHISELTLTKHNRKELLENLLVLHPGFVAELGLVALLCS